eukprot:jgi/Botrbrau1/22888/Bobra.0065s0041.1
MTERRRFCNLKNIGVPVLTFFLYRCEELKRMTSTNQRSVRKTGMDEIFESSLLAALKILLKVLLVPLQLLARLLNLGRRRVARAERWW